MNELTRLKLAVFDVRDREKEEVCWKTRYINIKALWTLIAAVKTRIQ